MVKEYYNNLKILKTLEDIFSVKNVTKEKFNKKVENLRDIVEEKKPSEIKEDIDKKISEYDNIDGLNSDQQKIVDKYLKDKDDLKSIDSKKLAKEVRDIAPSDWKPSAEFVSFYNKVNEKGYQSHRYL